MLIQILNIFRSSHLYLCCVSAWHTTQMALSGDDNDNITNFLKENGDSTIVKQPCQPFLAFMVRHEIDRLCDSQKIVWVLKRKPGLQKPTTFGLCALLGTLHNETHQSPAPKLCMSLLSAFLWILLCLINKSDSDINFCLFFYHIMNSVFLYDMGAISEFFENLMI